MLMVARRRLQRGKEILTCVVDKAIWNPNGRLYDVIPSRRPWLVSVGR